MQKPKSERDTLIGLARAGTARPLPNEQAMYLLHKFIVSQGLFASVLHFCSSVLIFVVVSRSLFHYLWWS